MNRFGACSCEYHLELASRVFGYLKTCPDEQIAIDSCPMIFDCDEPNFSKLIPDFLKDYPEASEEMDPGFLPSFGPIMKTVILIVLDHAEFSALRTATEEAQSIRYMLRCLGYHIPSDRSCPTKCFGDNLSIILNSQNHAADLSKKHVAISFHVVREAVAAGVVKPFWLKGEYNTSDILTK